MGVDWVFGGGVSDLLSISDDIIYSGGYILNIPKVQRRIYCYELKFYINNTLIENPGLLFNRFLKASGHKLSKNLFQLTSTEWMLMVLEQITPYAVKGFLGKLRYELPQLIDLDAEEITQLMLRDNTTLIEISHFIYYTDINVLMGEYNHYGLRHFTRLPDYMEFFSKHYYNECTLLPILNKEALERLKNGIDISSVTFKVAEPSVGFIEDILEIPISEKEVFNTILENYKGTNIEIIVSGDRKTKLSHSPVKRFGNKMLEIIKGKHENIKKANIVCNDGKIDLLSDDMFQDVQVLPLSKGSRHINSEEMYTAIHSFYVSKKGYLTDFTDKGEDKVYITPGDDYVNSNKDAEVV
jgi:hypothetical protein